MLAACSDPPGAVQADTGAGPAADLEADLDAGPEADLDAGPPVPTTDNRIELLEQRYGVVVGLWALDLLGGRSLAHRVGERFAMCSTFKTYAAAAVVRKSERGEIALSDTVTIEPADIIAHSPVAGTRVGAAMTLAELCQAALQQSDNAAANWLLRVLGGPSAITEFARSIGDEESRLDRWETELNSAVPGNLRDTSTPGALGLGYRNLLAGEALGAAGRQQLTDWMRGNATSSMRAGLPAGWTSADKSGSGGYGTTNDVGIAYAPDGRRLLLSMMSRSATDDPAAPNQRPMIGELTAIAVGDLLQGK
ncbi:MAG: class A beta-lactamase [Actinomycetia bacterium]|nr:class A beta-lactamase [Actinomycetes bacterium]